MQDIENENIDSSNDAVDEVEETPDTDTNEESVDESADDSEARLAALEEQNKKLFERAKKAESQVKELKAKPKAPETKPEAEPQKETLSATDIIAIAKSGIHDDDVSEVLDYAKFKGISASEALKSSYITVLRKENEEKRKSAEVSNTGTTRRSTSKLTPDMILENARRGVAPKTDEEWSKLIEARKALNKR